MNTPPSGRHLTTTDLMEHWDNGAPVVIPIDGTPALRLRIDPTRNRLTLRAPIKPGVEPPVNTMAHIATDIRIEGDQRFLEISTTDERLVVDGHAMLMAVADRIQLDGIDAIEALKQTLATWESILATRVRLTIQAEIGLFGELLVVQAMLDTAAQAPGPGEAVSAKNMTSGSPTPTRKRRPRPANNAATGSTGSLSSSPPAKPHSGCSQSNSPAPVKVKATDLRSSSTTYAAMSLRPIERSSTKTSPRPAGARISATC